MVGVLGASVAVIVGTLYGATSGYLGGKTDQTLALAQRRQREAQGESNWPVGFERNLNASPF